MKSKLKLLLIATLLIVLFGWLLDITTPKQCKVPIKQMSQGCIELLYPHN